MRLDYKGKKWDKEVDKFQKFKKQVNGLLNHNEMVYINEFTESGCNNYLRLYNGLSGVYERMSVYYYLDDIDSQEIIKYTYLSGRAMLITKRLYEKGIKIENYIGNSVIEDSLKRDLNYALYQLIAVEETDMLHTHIDEKNLIILMYNQKYDQAKEILDQLTDTPDESREVYYVSTVFIKPILMAIINNDEKSFNEELAKRIKKYRRNMVGYSTIIDIVSIALIKMAKQAGINCTVDVIEIPKQFFNEFCKVNKEEIELPFYDNILKLGIE